MKIIIISLAVLLAFNGALAEVVSRRVMGIVELPSVLGTRDPDGPPGLTPPIQIQAVSVHTHPKHDAPIIAEFVVQSSIQTEDFDYEAPGAVVYGVSDDWVLVRLTGFGKNKYGWISPQARGQFHELANLLKFGLNYLEEWDGTLFQEPGSEKKAKRIESINERQDVNVVKIVEHRGALWLEVEVLGPGRCEGVKPEMLAKGWIPAHKKDGSTNIWFYSRGC